MSSGHFIELHQCFLMECITKERRSTQLQDNNDLLVLLGEKVMMNASTISQSEDVFKMRQLIGKRIRVNYVVLRKVRL